MAHCKLHAAWFNAPGVLSPVYSCILGLIKQSVNQPTDRATDQPTEQTSKQAKTSQKKRKIKINIKKHTSRQLTPITTNSSPLYPAVADFVSRCRSSPHNYDLLPWRVLTEKGQGGQLCEDNAKSQPNSLLLFLLLMRLLLFLLLVIFSQTIMNSRPFNAVLGGKAKEGDYRPRSHLHENIISAWRFET